MKKKNFRPAHAKLQSASEILQFALKHHRLEKKVEEYSAFPYWKDIVGEEVARIAIPEKIVAGRVLVVRVLDAVWAQELALRKPELLEKLAAAETGALIQELRFITGNPKDFG